MSPAFSSDDPANVCLSDAELLSDIDLTPSIAGEFPDVEYISFLKLGDAVIFAPRWNDKANGKRVATITGSAGPFQVVDTRVPFVAVKMIDLAGPIERVSIQEQPRDESMNSYLPSTVKIAQPHSGIAFRPICDTNQVGFQETLCGVSPNASKIRDFVIPRIRQQPPFLFHEDIIQERFV